MFASTPKPQQRHVGLQYRTTELEVEILDDGPEQRAMRSEGVPGMG